MDLFEQEANLKYDINFQAIKTKVKSPEKSHS